MSGSLPPAGICPGCGQVAGGERCIHCGVAVRVGPYRVRQVLGQRGPARTYLADDADGLVVLKELSFSTEPSPATVQAFHQEARQLQSLTHPRIPRYLDMLQLGLGADLRLYLAQEFIEGTPLENELAGRHSTELEARELARQILDILRYLQSRRPQVFHGDLKPANLIRRPDGALFLVDFGAAWVRGGASPEASRYTPPDQAGGELDASTDLFSLGVTLVDALSWKQGGTGQEPDLTSLLDVESSFREFIARLTSVDPALRFASADEAFRHLDPPAQVRPSLASSMRPVALGAGAALFIFGGVITTCLTMRPAGVEHRLHTRPVAPYEPCISPKAPLRDTGIDQANPVGGTQVLTRRRVEEDSFMSNHRKLCCDLALRAPASDSGHLDSGGAEAAFDHDPDTFWRSDRSMDAWLQVDLGRVTVIDAVVLDWAWNGLGEEASSTVMISQDGDHWSPVYTVSTRSQTNNIPNGIWFHPRMARYVRFASTRWNKDKAKVNSFEVYGPECPLESPTEKFYGGPPGDDVY